MRMPSGARYTVPVLAVAAIVTATVGVTYASSSSKGVKACVAHQVIVAGGAKGNCPAGAKKVVIGKAGKPGPSAGYIDTNRRPVTIGNTSTTVLTLVLPKGSYLLTANVQLANESGLESRPFCFFASGNTDSLASQVPVEAQIGSPPATLPGEANLSLSSGLQLRHKGQVQLTCSAAGTVLATATASAHLVGKLIVSGGSPFTGSG